MAAFDLPGLVRRIRRCADLSQRELAERIDASKSSIARAETGTHGIDVRVVARAAAVAGLRLALVDADGREVAGMSGDTVRDLSGRRFPAHLDTCHSDERWWRYEHRFDRPRPWYTFDRDREHRDSERRALGTPDDHDPVRPGDSPQERKAQRRQAARQRRTEELRRRSESGEARPLEVWVCCCPPCCDEVDSFESRPVHAAACPCACDLA